MAFALSVRSVHPPNCPQHCFANKSITGEQPYIGQVAQGFSTRQQFPSGFRANVPRSHPVHIGSELPTVSQNAPSVQLAIERFTGDFWVFGVFAATAAVAASSDETRFILWLGRPAKAVATTGNFK
jgi:hypothetical protein